MSTEKSFKKMTKCICPNCKEEHKKKMHWTGKGIPKKYCHNCSKTTNISNLDPGINGKQRNHSFYGVEEK